MSDAAVIEQEAERVRQSGALGRSGSLRQLFDYLVAGSLVGERLTEIRIARDVFGKAETFDLSQDATVRVYIHRLRSKLANFYDGQEIDPGARLTIPKGEYRLCLTAQSPAETGKPSRRASLVWAVLLIALTANALLWWTAWPREPSALFVQARTAEPWARMFANGNPVTIVLGDYYIFGERDPARGVDRLVREYDINSLDDLDRRLMEKPELTGRYQHLDLSYLPEASGFALREILPVIVRAGIDPGNTRVVKASQLTPTMLKHSNIVYVGYFSGLGILRDSVFAASRFSIGDSWDEIIDEKTGRRFASAEGGIGSHDTESRDYGYFGSFAGPNGNRVIIVAGTRDMAVRQVAEAATRPRSLEEVAARTGRATNFDALYEVRGINRQNLEGRLLVAALRSTREGQAKLFPER